MITKACKQSIQTFPIWTTQNNTSNAKPMFPSSSVKNTAGQDRWVSFVNNNLLSSLTIQLNATNPGFHFGTGTTSPTEDDYKIESDITSGINVVLNSSFRSYSPKPHMTFTFTITNTSSSDITISETGIVTGNIWCCTSSSATSAAANNILIDRTLLDTPLTIAPSSTAALEYTVNCEMSFS